MQEIMARAAEAAVKKAEDDTAANLLSLGKENRKRTLQQQPGVSKKAKAGAAKKAKAGAAKKANEGAAKKAKADADTVNLVVSCGGGMVWCVVCTLGCEMGAGVWCVLLAVKWVQVCGVYSWL
jgi:hypothetical protein